MDYIRELGCLALASRLKRLTERLLRSGDIIYRSQGVDFEPRWFPVFSLLHSLGSPMSVTDIAKALRLTHPAVIQVTHIMAKNGLLRSLEDKGDRRKRLLILTDKGRQLARELEPIWRDFEAAIMDFFDSLGLDIMDIIQRIEDGLDREEMEDRILRRVRQRQLNEVEIVEYCPEYRQAFQTLNEEWIKKYFKVEDADLRIFSDPEAEIIQKKGFVLFARRGGQVVGTCALLRVDKSTYEIAKMAVTESQQRKQAGRKLALAAIEKARSLGAEAVFLKTDPRLKAAVSLYRSLGFVMSQETPLLSDRYQREKMGILMKLDLQEK